MLFTPDSLRGWSVAGGRLGGVCLGGGSGLPLASFQEGRWGLRGSWVLGGLLLGGMAGGEGGTQGFLAEGWSGDASWAVWWRDKETDQLPPRATTLRSSSPLGRRNGAPACGAATGAMAELGFVGRPVWISDSRPRWMLGHPDGHLDRLAQPGSGARRQGPRCRAGTHRCRALSAGEGAVPPTAEAPGGARCRDRRGGQDPQNAVSLPSPAGE